MALTKFRLGCAIEPFSRACGNPHVPAMNISGVNRDKEFFEPSHQVGSDTSKYQFVPPNYFACNLMHVGRDCVLPIAMNHTDRNKIVSPAYTVFSLKDATPLLREYFFMMLKCPERDREFWFHTDASVRDGMAWKDFCDIEFDLPPLSVQEKYVAVYNSMAANLKAYEKGLADLKLACDVTIEELRRKHKSQRIGPYLQPVDERNSSLTVRLSQGISTEKKFTDSKQVAEDKKNAKIVRPGQFAYNRATTRNGDKISIALREGEPCVVSSAYQVFEVADKSRLDPHYLMLWFTRSEFDRYARYHSKGSAHEFFEYADMEDVEFPIPTLEEQECVSSIYKTYVKRMELKNVLEGMIRSLCPILIKGSLEEGKRM